MATRLALRSTCVISADLNDLIFLRLRSSNFSSSSLSLSLSLAHSRGVDDDVGAVFSRGACV